MSVNARHPSFPRISANSFARPCLSAGTSSGAGTSDLKSAVSSFPSRTSRRTVFFNASRFENVSPSDDASASIAASVSASNVNESLLFNDAFEISAAHFSTASKIPADEVLSSSVVVLGSIFPPFAAVSSAKSVTVLSEKHA